jgi:hypothetical protein
VREKGVKLHRFSVGNLEGGGRKKGEEGRGEIGTRFEGKIAGPVEAKFGTVPSGRR